MFNLFLNQTKPTTLEDAKKKAMSLDTNYEMSKTLDSMPPPRERLETKTKASTSTEYLDEIIQLTENIK